MKRLILYVSESCRYCEGAHATTKRLAVEYGVPYNVLSVDEHQDLKVPAVPALLYDGILYVGLNFERRLRLALESQDLNLQEVIQNGVL